MKTHIEEKKIDEKVPTKILVDRAIERARNKGFNFGFDYLYKVSVEDDEVLLKHRDNYDEPTNKYITRLSHIEALVQVIDYITKTTPSHDENKEEEQLIHDLGYMFETIGGYFDMGNTEEARKHFEVAYRMLGDYVKNKVNKLIKEQNDRRNTKKAHK